MTESRRSAAFYRAEARVLNGSAIDKGASPVLVKEMASAVGWPDAKVVVHYGVRRAVAAARPKSGALHFSPSALTVPVALHEIAHLVAGSKAQHGEKFVGVFLRLLKHVGGPELAERFEMALDLEGPGLWNRDATHPAVA